MVSRSSEPYVTCYLFSFRVWAMRSFLWRWKLPFHDLWSIGRPHFRVIFRIWGKGFIFFVMFATKLTIHTASMGFETCLSGKVYTAFLTISSRSDRFMCVKTSVRTQLNNYVFLEIFPIGSRYAIYRLRRMKRMNGTNNQHLFYWKFLVGKKCNYLLVAVGKSIY